MEGDLGDWAEFGVISMLKFEDNRDEEKEDRPSDMVITPLWGCPKGVTEAGTTEFSVGTIAFPANLSNKFCRKRRYSSSFNSPCSFATASSLSLCASVIVTVSVFVAERVVEVPVPWDVLADAVETKTDFDCESTSTEFRLTEGSGVVARRLLEALVKFLSLLELTFLIVLEKGVDWVLRRDWTGAASVDAVEASWGMNVPEEESGSAREGSVPFCFP
jgi:hypothetical protein